MTGYAGTSMLAERGGSQHLQLETALGLTPEGLVDHPTFFSGIVARPDVVAAGILTVADVAATTYFDLTAILASLDPVVTASGDRLRFESFSTCNGAHARFDLLADGIDSGDVRFGTTNVDVNAPLRTGLARVGREHLLHLGIGPDELRVSTFDDTHVERKVELPDRWVRGFAETPVLAAGMEQVATANGVTAMRFLAGLPTGAPGPTVEVAQVRDGLKIVPASAGMVTLAGTARLSAARRLTRFIKALRIYRHASGASGWLFDLEGGRVTLLLTAEPYRGFSGEGGLLGDLVHSAPSDADRLMEHLAWQPVIDPAQLAEESGLPAAKVRAGLAALATSGRVGFDLAESAWFHRELPLDADRIAKDNPRLVAARKLVAEGAVVRVGDRWRVGDSGHEHWVTLGKDRPRCTCRWEAKYAGSRGPCSHILAVQAV